VADDPSLKVFETAIRGHILAGPQVEGYGVDGYVSAVEIILDGQRGVREKLEPLVTSPLLTFGASKRKLTNSAAHFHEEYRERVPHDSLERKRVGRHTSYQEIEVVSRQTQEAVAHSSPNKI
jgi:hypothetical protein